MSDSLITKRAIASALKEVIKTKSFDKITINDITEKCGLNRQSFYYHFQDKYELVDWIYYNETISIIIEDLNTENWSEKILLMLHQMKKEEHFYKDTLKSSSGNGFNEYIFKIVSELFFNLVESTEKNPDFNEKERYFISEFYAYGICGVINSWALNGMKETPEELTLRFKVVSEGTKRYAVKHYKNL